MPYLFLILAKIYNEDMISIFTLEKILYGSFSFKMIFYKILTSGLVLIHIIFNE